MLKYSETNQRKVQVKSSFLFYSLMPQTLKNQFEGKEPLIIALYNNFFQSFELYIEMLMLDTLETPYMMSIKKNLIKLLSYDSELVHRFLQTRCQKQLYSVMLAQKQLTRNYKEFSGSNTEYYILERDEAADQPYKPIKDEMRLDT